MSDRPSPSRWTRLKGRVGGTFASLSAQGRRHVGTVLALLKRTALLLEASLLGPREAVNQRNLYLEALWFGVLNGLNNAFLIVFGVRMGASPFQVGLLTAMPALVNIIFPMPAARLMERQRDRISLIMKAVLWQRGTFLLLALIPLLGVRLQTGALILLNGLITLPAVMVNLGVTVLVSELVPATDRALVVSRRYVVLSTTSALVALAGGWWLDRISFPVNYQSMFAVGGLVSLLSILALRRVQLPPAEVIERRRERSPLRIRIRAVWQDLLSQKPFLSFCGSAFFYSFVMSLPLALYQIYRVRYLGANDRWVGSISTLATAASVVGYFVWGRYARRKGEQWLLVLSSAGLALYPALTGLTTSLPPLLVVGVVGGFFSAGLTLGLFNSALSVAPAKHRPTYIALYTVLINVAAFVAPPLGSMLGDAIGIRMALYWSGALRLVGSALFVLFLLGLPRLRGGRT